MNAIARRVAQARQAIQKGKRVLVYGVGATLLAPGDVLVFGACAAEISEEYTEDDLIRGHGAVIVQSVADNTLRPRLRSWKVVCV